MLGALLRHASEAGTDLHTLDRVDAHHCRGQLGVELGVDRCAPAGRHVLGPGANQGADRIALLAQGIHVVLELGHARRVRTEERVVVDRFGDEVFIADDLAELTQPGGDPDTELLLQVLCRQRAGGDPHRGLASR